MSMLKFVMKGYSGKRKRKKMTDEEIDTKIQEKLKVFGIEEFRTHQKEIIFNLIKGNDFQRDTGKLCLDGVSIIISPLISLMVDQVSGLRKKGIKARTWNSQVRITELRELKEDLISPRPRTKILFTTPESLLSENMRTPLNLLKRRGLISLFAIDEAHCISQWGFDFRPKYKSSLASLKLKYPKVPIIALTATATNAVKKDVLDTLNLNDPKLFVSSFNRPEIRYKVKYKSLTPNGHMWDIVRFIKNERPDDLGIIYCRTIRKVEELVQYLRSQGVSQVEMYHGKMKRKLRNEISERWKIGQVKVLVATIAFGMGVDKADIRYVIHETVPQSIEAFYQESGRAGRDRQPSESLLYYSTMDKDDVMYLINNDKRTNSQRKDVLRSKFADMCKLCEAACCRRLMIVQYFGDQLNPFCNGTCDYCRNPNRVLDSIRRAVMTISRKAVWNREDDNDDWSRELNVVYDKQADDDDLLTPLTRRRYEDPEVLEIRRQVTVRKRTQNVHITDDQPLDMVLDNLEEDEQRTGQIYRKRKKKRSFRTDLNNNNNIIMQPPPPSRNRSFQSVNLAGRRRIMSESEKGVKKKKTKKKKGPSGKKKQSILSLGRRRTVEVGKKRKRGGNSTFVSANTLLGDKRIKKKRKLE